MALNAHFRSVTDRIVRPFGVALVRMKVSANTITTLGLLGVFVGMGLLLLGMPVLGASIAGVAVVLDAFDGTVARMTGTQTELGGFFDSVADRVGDAVIFGACLWLVRDDPVTFSVLMVATASAFTTSYIRAKAEAMGWDATVGLIERPERMLIILPGAGLGFLPVSSWILAVGGVVTILQRLYAVLQQARAGVAEKAKEPAAR